MIYIRYIDIPRVEYKMKKKANPILKNKPGRKGIKARKRRIKW